MQTVLLTVISLVVLYKVNFCRNKGTWMFPYVQARHNHNYHNSGHYAWSYLLFRTQLDITCDKKIMIQNPWSHRYKVCWIRGLILGMQKIYRICGHVTICSDHVRIYWGEPCCIYFYMKLNTWTFCFRYISKVIKIYNHVVRGSTVFPVGPEPINISECVPWGRYVTVTVISRVFSLKIVHWIWSTW
jgi:hypothetical protein